MAVLKDGQRQINIRVNPDLHRALKYASIDQRLTMESIAERALTAWLMSSHNDHDAGIPQHA